MSISSALNSAMSGLTAASRASAIVSENIANVMTPGYARRSLELASATDSGPGVRIVGTLRHSDPVILSERRRAESDHVNSQVLADFHTKFESLVGTATDPASISMRLADFESSLISAASHPESVLRLDGVASATKDLVGAITSAAQGLRTMRTQADKSIGSQVDRLNTALADVQKLNTRITSTLNSGGDISSFQDQRQRLVDDINEIVPINQTERSYGQIALYTNGGAILLDGRAAVLEFAVANETVPEMSIESGTLSGLQINGVSVSSRVISGGTLAANFQIRDELSVSAQADLDAVSRDLIERFETPSLDLTTTTGAPGLFTDGGAAFDATLQVGLAGRLAVNAVVDPAQSGESWRLRAGLGAMDAGMPGESRQLQAFLDVLTDPRTPGSAVFGTGLVTAAELGSGLMSRAAQHSSTANRAVTLSAASAAEMTRIELAQGVDTDAELQSLMIVEQAYAANARMIEAVDEMMKTLLRL